jgi:hypothetical protein
MIERGRYFNINKNERHCPICKTGQVEDENHFILKCKDIPRLFSISFIFFIHSFEFFKSVNISRTKVFSEVKI